MYQQTGNEHNHSNIDLDELAEKVRRNQRLTKEERLAALYNPKVCQVTGPPIVGRPASPTPAAGRPSMGAYYYVGPNPPPDHSRPNVHPPSQPQYPPSQPQYPPSQPQYPPSQPQYPPSQPQYPPSQPQYPPSQPQYPPYSPSSYDGPHHDSYTGSQSIPHQPSAPFHDTAPTHGMPAGNHNAAPSHVPFDAHDGPALSHDGPALSHGDLANHHAAPHGHMGSHHDEDTDSEGAHSAHPDQPKRIRPQGPSKSPLTDPHAKVPSQMYDIPASLWDGLHMSGKFVAKSDVGNVALIITVPHDGKMKSRDPKRLEGLSIPEDHTMDIALTIFQDVKNALGAPTIVTQLLHRSWVDVNRGMSSHGQDTCFDHPDGQHAYYAFHHAIIDACAVYKKRGIIPLLIDLHGNEHPEMKGKVAAAYGGHTGKLIPGLKKNYGDPKYVMWTGPNALLEAFDNNRLKVHKGDPPFGGGYTVKHYSQMFGIDCIQLEFDAKYRSSPRLAQLAGHAVAKALVPFLRQYPCRV